MAMICYRWGSADVIWKDSNWIWSMCASGPPVPVIDVLVNKPGVDATTLIQPWLIEPWNPYRAGEEKAKQDKKKRLISMIFKIMGEEYKESKEIKSLKMGINEVKMTIKPSKDIDLKIKDNNVI